jgi:hypothetical protein
MHVLLAAPRGSSGPAGIRCRVASSVSMGLRAAPRPKPGQSRVDNQNQRPAGMKRAVGGLSDPTSTCRSVRLDWRIVVINSQLDSRRSAPLRSEHDTRRQRQVRAFTPGADDAQTVLGHFPLSRPGSHRAGSGCGLRAVEQERRRHAPPAAGRRHGGTDSGPRRRLPPVARGRFGQPEPYSLHRRR